MGLGWNLKRWTEAGGEKAGKEGGGKEVRSALLSFFTFYLETSAWGKRRKGREARAEPPRAF